MQNYYIVDKHQCDNIEIVKILINKKLQSNRIDKEKLYTTISMTVKYGY
ncbi:hypothetical protein CBB2_3204 [Clostridium botulinum]|nr:hypothetical protein [Clostridium botulinum]BAQ36207.1 hypothetical protein CBB2_3204 [Clostridium botulinum]